MASYVLRNVERDSAAMMNSLAPSACIHRTSCEILEKVGHDYVTHKECSYPAVTPPCFSIPSEPKCKSNIYLSLRRKLALEQE